MTAEEAIKWLKNDSCYCCSVGCESAYTCRENQCELKAAVQKAVEVLELMKGKK